MSFSSDVKEELCGRMGAGRHCQLAELAVLFAFDREIPRTKHPLLKQKYESLVKELFAGEDPYAGQTVHKLLRSVKMWDEMTCDECISDTVDGLLIQKTCCRRAFLRGAFLVAGSISDPEKSYHFEIVCRSVPQAKQIQNAVNSFEMDAKIVERKKHYVVYLKEGAQIIDILNVMQAHVALLNLENVRILKGMRNCVNRKVNCETANITKTVGAAVKQIEDINYICEVAGMEYLPDNLKEMARLRLLYPDAPLKELGTYLNPPVGKSGVNHRLRRIGEIADNLRNNRKTL